MAQMLHSFDNYGLHIAALDGDDDRVNFALTAGADINALDNAARTAVMCAVAGEDWQNVDASDASFMSPQRLNAIKTLLAHPDISLLTLNAPVASMNGVIPLGMAAWLNLPEVVRLLLDNSADCVSVDGMDAQGATALMYAARDGNTEVVQILLAHGARPDFRDCHHRTALQFGLAQPQILWLCETSLRRHRCHENQSAERTRLFPSQNVGNLLRIAVAAIPPAPSCETSPLPPSLSSPLLSPPPVSVFSQSATRRFTQTLTTAILAADLGFIQSLLFTPPPSPASPASLYPLSVPALVNSTDGRGWSAIHYCVAAKNPSVDVLDALYLAGADVGLYCKDGWAPVHLIARGARVCEAINGQLSEWRADDDGDDERQCEKEKSLCEFVVHLVRDLRAPLSAKDKNDETCLHVAAEHGSSIEVLNVLLECDVNKRVRELKNSRGLTPLQVCKREFLVAFGLPNVASKVFAIDHDRSVSSQAEAPRSNSSLSSHTIRQTESFASIASFSDWNPTPKLTHISSTPNLRTHSTINDSDFPFPPEIKADELPAASEQLLSHLRLTSPSRKQTHHHFANPSSIEYLSDTLMSTSHLTRAVLSAFSARINDVASAVRELQETKEEIEGLRDAVHDAARSQAATRAVKLVCANGKDEKKRNRDSEDSQATRVENVEDEEVCEEVKIEGEAKNDQLQRLESGMDSFSGIPSNFDEHVGCIEKEKRKHTKSRLRKWFKRIMGPHPHPDVQAETHPPQERDPHTRSVLPSDISQPPTAPPSPSHRSIIQEASLRRREEIHLPSHPERYHEANESFDSEDAEGEQVDNDSSEGLPSESDPFNTSIDVALRTSHIVLENAKRDLTAIGDSLNSAENFIELATFSVARTERVVKRAIKKREAMLGDLRNSLFTNLTSSPNTAGGSPGLLGYSLSTRPRAISLASLASNASIYSSASNASTLSLAHTLTDRTRPNTSSSTVDAGGDHDDEDTRIVRRLLIRKLEAQISGAWNEVERVAGWIKIVKEVVRGVRRRAYL